MHQGVILAYEDVLGATAMAVTLLAVMQLDKQCHTCTAGHESLVRISKHAHCDYAAHDQQTCSFAITLSALRHATSVVVQMLSLAKGIHSSN